MEREALAAGVPLSNNIIILVRLPAAWFSAGRASTGRALAPRARRAVLLTGRLSTYVGKVRNLQDASTPLTHFS
jgi:hypothetical protein